MNDIRVLHDGQVIGPYNEQTLSTAVNSGVILSTDTAWHDGLAEWVPIHQLLGLPPPKLHKKMELSATAKTVRSEVVITGVNIPFANMVNLLLTIGVASIPAALLFGIIMAIPITILLILGHVH